MTIQKIISKIIEGNSKFTELHKKEYFESFRSEQRPYITLVSCSDSRVTLNALMRDTSNSIFTIQNIGNQLLSNEGSVDYGICHLKTPLLMFLGHSDCGAIKACLKGYDRESFGIKHELDFLGPVINNCPGDEDFTRQHTRLIQKNLDYQVNVACNKYKDLIRGGKLTVIAAYYDFRGDFGKGQGDIIIVNVNNCIDIDKMCSLPEFTDLKPSQKELHIGRFC